MARKRVEAEDTTTSTATATANSMVRGKDGSAFAKCDDCKKDVPVALISMHNCSLEARIKMNLEAHVVENPAEVKKKSAERKKPTSTLPKSKKSKTNNTKTNLPNKPKRPPTAFFIFLDEFRKVFKEANPGSKDVKRVAKEAGEKWKAMTDEEKKPYVDKATELKAEYDKALQGANDAENDDDDGGSSEKEDAERQEEQEVPDEE